MTMIALAAIAALAGGPFLKPNSERPQLDKSAVEIETQRQLDYVLDVRLTEEARVEAVADRLLRANAPLCPATGPRLGFSVASFVGVKGPMKDALTRRWGETDRLRVVSLSPDGAGVSGGLQIGDDLISVNDTPVAKGKKAHRKWLKQQEAILDEKPATVRLSIERGGAVKALTLTPQIACAYNVVLDQEAGELNAYADGRTIYVTRPMYKLAASDDELALVLSHELAHNARRHIDAKKRNAAVGMLGGALLDVALAATTGVILSDGGFTKMGGQLGAGAYSPEFESEADYVGLYFMARAGFRIDGAENFWRKMAAESPNAIFQKGSHPPTAERYVAIAATRTEIASRGSDLALLAPSERSKAAQAGPKQAIR